MIFEEMSYDVEQKINNHGIKYPHNMLVGFWPLPEFSNVDWSEDAVRYLVECHYRAIACTYQTELQMVGKPSEIILLDDRRPWISIEEEREGHESLPHNQYDYPDEAIYFVGNTQWRHLSDYFEVDQVIHLDTPGGYEHPLYGDQAAAIVLQQQFQQRLSRLQEERCGTEPASA